MKKLNQTPEAHEMYMANLAISLAEQRLKNGTATSAEIIQFAKPGFTRDREEIETLRSKNSLLQAQIENLKAMTSTEDSNSVILDALKSYRGDSFEIE